MSVIKLNIVKGRNFPIMDSKSMLADAYCEIRFGPKFHFKTSIAKKTLNPVWNNASFRIEVPSSRYAQDNIMEIRVWDYDLVRSNDDLIGTIYIDPNIFDDNVDEMQGWLPVFDSLNGIRGELYVIVKFQILENLNPFRESSSLVTVYSHGSQELLEQQLAYELQLKQKRRHKQRLHEQQQQQQQQHQQQRQQQKQSNAKNVEKRKTRLSADDTFAEGLPSGSTSGSLPEHFSSIIGDRRLTSTSLPPLRDKDIVTYKYTIETFTEELLMEEDPEHEFLESLRSSRVTNSRRQLLLFQLSGRVRRMMGKKVEEMKGDVLCGYQENFDLEEDNIIVRAIGTICRRQQITIPYANLSSDDHTSSTDITPLSSPKLGSPWFGRISTLADMSQRIGSLPREVIVGSGGGGATFDVSPKLTDSSPFKSIPTLHLHSHETDSDTLRSDGSGDLDNTIAGAHQHKMASVDDVTLITMTSFEPHMIVEMGSVITVRSVKHVLDMKRSMLVEQRDEWWQELRDEVKSHAHSMRCTHVLGYNEHTVIYKDLCILSATGTAAVLNNSLYNPVLREDIHQLLPSKLVKKHRSACKNICSMFRAHISPKQDSPYSSTPLTRCKLCGQHIVPEVLLSTLEIPKEAAIVPKSKRLIEARICKTKRKKHGEGNAKVVSQIMPFIDVELHKQLLLKMKLYSLNCCFNLQYDISVSDTKIVVILTGTGCFSSVLPIPGSLNFVRTLTVQDEEDKKMFAVQSKLRELSKFNNNSRANQQREFFNRILVSTTLDTGDGSEAKSSNDSKNDGFLVENSSVSPLHEDTVMKTGFVLEIDDDVDEDLMAALMEPQLPSGLIWFSNLKNAFVQEPILQECSSFLHSILMQKRFLINVPSDHMNEHLKKLFDDLYRELAFRCQMFLPCAVVGIRNDVKMTNDSEILICTRASVIMLPSNVDSCDFSQIIHRDGEIEEEERKRRNNEMMLFDQYKMPLLLHMHAPRSPSQQLMNEILARNKQSKDLQEQHKHEEQSSSSYNNSQEESAPLNVNSKIVLQQEQDNHANLGSEEKLMFAMDELDQDAKTSSAGPPNSEDVAESDSIAHSDLDLNSELDSDSGSDTDSNDEGGDDNEQPQIQAFMKKAQFESSLLPEFDTQWMKKSQVIVSNGWDVPGCRVVSVFSRIAQHLVRESDVGYVDNGQTFVQTLLSEAMQIIKAHATALGANCILNLAVDYHVHDFRKQSYSLLSISGDAAIIETIAPSACFGTARIGQFNSGGSS